MGVSLVLLFAGAGCVALHVRALQQVHSGRGAGAGQGSRPGSIRADAPAVELRPGSPVNSRRPSVDLDNRHPLNVLDLTRLPGGVHEVLLLLLLMPLGALVTSFLCTVVGIPTYGTFTPTLLALSFVYADWRSGLIVLVFVLTTGLISRTLLDRLQLLIVPRLSVVLTIIVLCMVAGVALLDRLEFTPGSRAVLLPLVILTMIIERFNLASEEDGVGPAIQKLGGTFAVGLCCYSVFAWAVVAKLVLLFPEIHLLTLGLLILMGRYKGYRWTELVRFRDLAQPGPLVGHDRL
jgi:hypothetical protein